ncbi:MAG: hypothetical protein V3S43_03540 [Acidimicrobiia bacterium]
MTTEPKGQNRNVWFRDPSVLDALKAISRKTHRTVNLVLTMILENEIDRYEKDPSLLETRRPQQ